MSTTITYSGITVPAFTITAEFSTDVPGNPLMVLATQDEVDRTACRLSAMMPLARVTVQTMARTKAVYYRGKRQNPVNDYRTFYSNMTDAEYTATKFKDSLTAELI